MSCKLYEGFRDDRGAGVLVMAGVDQARWLPFRLDLWNHSPAGFEWGYHGSGPAQLALALLADALDDNDAALFLHQPFKRAIIAALPHQRWILAQEFIAKWANQYSPASCSLIQE
jgi:Family of unknown function (DUF6166)